MTDPVFIGLDTGLSGGVVTLSAQGAILHAGIMPVVSSGKHRRTDAMALRSLLSFLTEGKTATITIEDPGGHAPSATGLASMSRSYATCLTVIELGGYRHHPVFARTWQAEFWKRPKMAAGAKFDTKAAALTEARRLWPAQDWTKSERAILPHDGMVDAALIAEYGRRKLR